MASIPFVKMHGLGNDFVVIDDLGKSPHNLGPQEAQTLCDRRFGIGADQVLWLKASQGPGNAGVRCDVRMEILNSDGSSAEMCGNGIRAVALYLQRHSAIKGRSSYRIETLAGTKIVTIKNDLVNVDMGAPGLGAHFDKGEALKLSSGQELRFHEVSMGNPHAVFFTDRVSTVDLEKIGPEIERHPRFPKRTNVEFVEVTGPSSIKIRVWERGAGITLACGTGACASAVATLGTGRAQGRLEVVLPGGALQIGWEGASKRSETHPVMMEGPATEVFRGEYLLG